MKTARRNFVVAASVGMLSAPLAVRPQQQTLIRIGLLRTTSRISVIRARRAYALGFASLATPREVGVSKADLAAAVATARERADALLPLGAPFFTAHRVLIATLATRHRLLGVYYWKEFVEAGCGQIPSYSRKGRQNPASATAYLRRRKMPFASDSALK
ncbi:MAG TPA: hypothetical protein VFR66_06770 [Burkholderiales bacterium]|nr:hypothetical protein [Burkholderiales bacterium]